MLNLIMLSSMLFVSYCEFTTYYSCRYNPWQFCYSYRMYTRLINDWPMACLSKCVVLDIESVWHIMAYRHNTSLHVDILFKFCSLYLLIISSAYLTFSVAYWFTTGYIYIYCIYTALILMVRCLLCDCLRLQWLVNMTPNRICDCRGQHNVSG